MDTRRLAEWWCALNGLRWPIDLPGPPSPTREHARAAWHVVNALAGKDGKALWQKRFKANLNPVTGESYADESPR